MSANIVVDVCGIMLGLDGALHVCDVIVWVAFVDVNVAQGYGLWWGNVSGVLYLILMEVCV
jgi:hypothetical protein